MTKNDLGNVYKGGAEVQRGGPACPRLPSQWDSGLGSGGAPFRSVPVLPPPILILSLPKTAYFTNIDFGSSG